VPAEVGRHLPSLSRSLSLSPAARAWFSCPGGGRGRRAAEAATTPTTTTTTTTATTTTTTTTAAAAAVLVVVVVVVVVVLVVVEAMETAIVSVHTSAAWRGADCFRAAPLERR
jgi:hypothetical protein